MKAKVRKTSATIGLLIEQKRDNGFFHIYARPVWIGLTPGDMEDIDRRDNIERRPVDGDRIRGIGSYQNERVNGLYYENLCVTSQGNCDDATRHLYAWELCYHDVYTIDADKATQMAKTLTAVEKRLDILCEKYARPATFSAYLLRIADAIGATRFVFNESEAPHSGRVVFELSGGAYRVDGMINRWVTEREGAAS